MSDSEGSDLSSGSAFERACALYEQVRRRYELDAAEFSRYQQQQILDRFDEESKNWLSSGSSMQLCRER